MGCDIHTFVEVEINGHWQFLAKPHYPAECEQRNYYRFWHLANVRTADSQKWPRFEPKGLPEQVSPIVQHILTSYWGTDAHSVSWMPLPPFIEVVKRTMVSQIKNHTSAIDLTTWLLMMNKTDRSYEDTQAVFGQDVASTMEQLYEGNRNNKINYRVVYWFDN